MAIGEATLERSDRLDKNQNKILKWFLERGIELDQIAEYHYLAVDVFDYWPRTGLFIHRKTKKRGRGKKSLIRAINRELNCTNGGIDGEVTRKA